MIERNDKINKYKCGKISALKDVLWQYYKYFNKPIFLVCKYSRLFQQSSSLLNYL